MDCPSPTLIVLSLVALLLVGVAVPVFAGEKTITVEEQLNRHWSHELMTYPFAAAQGQCAPESVTLTGPNGAQPVQLSEVTLWPGTQSVQSARLSFLVEDLPPQTTQTYTVTYAPDGKRAIPANDLTILPVADSVTVITNRFGARFLLGEKVYATPASAAEVPAPVLSMRLADGVWFGGSRFYGTTPIKSWSAKLTDSGPVFAQVETSYTYADGNTLTVTNRLAAGDYALQTEMTVKQDAPQDGWELLLNHGIAIPDGVRLTGMRTWSKEQPITFDRQSTAPACYLSPWCGDGWFPDSPMVLRLKMAGRTDELQMSVRDNGAWVAPVKDPWWGNFNKWETGAPDRIWAAWQRKRIPIIPADGGVLLRMSLMNGQRKWTVGAHADGKRLWDVFLNKDTGLYTQQARLNDVKEMVLSWPDGPQKHPYQYLNAQELAQAGVRNTAALNDLQDVEKLRGLLNSLGNLDLFRICFDVAARYDALIDSPKLSPQERKLFKAQMAYFGYMAASPLHWSFERGYVSGNPNMSTSRVINVGIIGFALRDNPQGKLWAQYGMEWAKYWLNNVVDDCGFWPESSHYARVSWSDYAQLAVVARNAKAYDFFADPKFKAMALFYEKTLTPPDPLCYVDNATPRPAKSPHPRIDPPYGRGTAGDVWGLSGIIARATAASDPALSRIMQWSWRECGYVEQFGHTTAGMGALYANRDLPAERPDWHSEYFPPLGYLLRSRVGEPDENYLLFVSQYFRNADGEIWPGDTGAIAKWFAGGKPIGGSFSRWPPDISHPMMESRVALAANWNPAQENNPDSGYITQTSQDGFTTLPGAEYVNAGFTVTGIRQHFVKMVKTIPAFPQRDKVGAAPFHWQRQLLLMSDASGETMNYLVLHDTVAGKQPTQWNFWTLSEKVGTPQETADRAAFLADKPGNKTAPLRALTGNRFTALGQFGVDTEYYVASPTDTPCFTLRHGLVSSPYGTAAAVAEYQDTLNLQLPGDGAYFVTLFPHSPDQPAPVFTTLGGGTVIKVAGAFGTDYCFLSKLAANAKADMAAFTGTAASIQDRRTGLILHLSTPGSVQYRDYTLASAFPASLRVAPYALTLTLPEGSAGGQITVKAPGKWTTSQPGVMMKAKGGGYLLTVPANTRTVTMTAK